MPCSFCILKAELQAPWPVLPSPLAILQLKERSHEGSSHCGLYCGGSRLQLWNQQEVIAYLHTLMFNYSQPPTGCVGWALSSLMVTWWWIRGTESSVLKVKWASRDIASFLLFQSSKPYSTLELLRKEKRWILPLSCFMIVSALSSLGNAGSWRTWSRTDLSW